MRKKIEGRENKVHMNLTIKPEVRDQLDLIAASKRISVSEYVEQCAKRDIKKAKAILSGELVKKG